MFRRRPADSPDVLDQDPHPPGSPEEVPGTAGTDQPDRASFTPGKGRPTPKRSEAERRRRQPYTAPADRKAAAQQSRTAGRTARASRTEAMKRGEQWALPRKDQGPVRALARDYVDSRRGMSEYYVFGIIVLVVLLFIPSLRKSLIVDYVLILMLLVVVAEGMFVGRKVIMLAQQRYPSESTRGVKLYSAVRGTQFRKLRMPAPRVKRGDPI